MFALIRVYQTGDVMQFINSRRVALALAIILGSHSVYYFVSVPSSCATHTEQVLRAGTYKYVPERAKFAAQEFCDETYRGTMKSVVGL